MQGDSPGLRATATVGRVAVTRGALIWLAALSTASIFFILVTNDWRYVDSQAELMGVGAYTYMQTRNFVGQQDGVTGVPFSRPGQPAMDFAEPAASNSPPSPQQQLKIIKLERYSQLADCSQSLAGCPPSASEMTNPIGAPNYNSGEGMTYMPSTQSGVSDTDRSPDISQEFLDEEKKSKKHMKKLAKLLKKTAKEQDALDVKVRFLMLIDCAECP